MPKLVPTAAVADEDARKRLFEALVDRMKSKGVRVDLHDMAHIFGGGVYSREGMTKKGPQVMVGPNLANKTEGISILAHEAGHAEFDRELLGKLVQSKMLRGAAGMAIPIGTLIAATATGSLARRIALSAGTAAALQVPLLTGEGVASMRGHKMLEEHGASTEQLDHMKDMAVRAGSSYLIPGALSVGSALIFAALSHAAEP